MMKKILSFLVAALFISASMTVFAGSHCRFNVDTLSNVNSMHVVSMSHLSLHKMASNKDQMSVLNPQSNMTRDHAVLAIDGKLCTLVALVSFNADNGVHLYFSVSSKSQQSAFCHAAIAVPSGGDACFEKLETVKVS